MILYIKHIDIEGPETIQDFFEAHGFTSSIVEMGVNEKLPENLKSIDAVVSMGGPMNVYEEDKYPFLKMETEFIRAVLSNHIPFLGVCLGSQMLAKVAGGRVVKSPNEEIGFSTVQLTKEGKEDLLFQGLGDELIVFQWHGDMFHIPSGGNLLAASSACPHQAIKVGCSAYGLQFHVEVTDRNIREWSESYYPNTKEGRLKIKSMLDDYKRNKKDFLKAQQTIYNNFLKVITIRKQILLPK